MTTRGETSTIKRWRNYFIRLLCPLYHIATDLEEADGGPGPWGQARRWRDVHYDDPSQIPSPPNGGRQLNGSWDINYTSSHPNRPDGKMKKRVRWADEEE